MAIVGVTIAGLAVLLTHDPAEPIVESRDFCVRETFIAANDGEPQVVAPQVYDVIEISENRGGDRVAWLTERPSSPRQSSLRVGVLVSDLEDYGHPIEGAHACDLAD
jgi:hypothetical protein